MDQKLSFITLGVKDLGVSVDFYEKKLGWKRNEMSDEKIIFFQLNGLMFALYNRTELAEDATVESAGSGFPGFALSYLTTSEKEVDETIEELRTKGVVIVKEPQKVFWGGYSSYI